MEEQEAYVTSNERSKPMLPWKIWFEHFNEKGEQIGAGVLIYEYKYRGHAIRRAKRHFENRDFNGHKFTWVVSQTNPWMQLKGEN